MLNQKILGLACVAAFGTTLSGCALEVADVPAFVAVHGATVIADGGGQARPAAPQAAPADGIQPIIQSFTANPTNTTTAGQPITFQLVATNPSNGGMQYNWSSTGGLLSTTAGQVVVWTPPTTPGLYTVQAIVTNSAGGATSGAENLTVLADGTVQMVAAPTPITVTTTAVATSAVTTSTATTGTTSTTTAPVAPAAAILNPATGGHGHAHH